MPQLYYEQQKTGAFVWMMLAFVVMAVLIAAAAISYMLTGGQWLSGGETRPSQAQHRVNVIDITQADVGPPAPVIALRAT